MEAAPQQTVADGVKGSWVYRLPPAFWPFAQLARWERPIGWQLLMWPCWWAALLAAHSSQISTGQLVWFLALFAAGSIVMRGAGCTFNDLMDQDIDEKVARTRSRPLPSGRVSQSNARLFLLAQLVVGLIILLQFNWTSIALGTLSLLLVFTYPFMKRITWWPQLFLGLAFSWGALVGWSAVSGSIGIAALLLYAGSICWVIAYDTIYAMQDLEDDALVGVKSTARLFGENAPQALAALYGAAIVLFVFSFWLAGAFWPARVGLLLAGIHLAWQVLSLDRADPAKCLLLFKSNSRFGLLLFLGLLFSLMLSPAQ